MYCIVYGFWNPEHQRLISMVSFTFTKRSRLIRLASSPLTSSRLAKFGWVPFAVCNVWQRSRTQNLRRVGEISGPILTRLLTKVYEIFRRYSRSFVLPTPLPIVYVTLFRRYSSWSLEFVKNQTDTKVFGPIFWERWHRLFYCRLLARFTVHRLTKFGWVLFVGLRLRSLATK